jgi:hypothetical protein
MIASFAMLGMLLAASACSKQSAKPALVGVSLPVSTPAAPATLSPAVTPATGPATPVAKTRKKRPSSVTYSDAISGVSFLYPRKAKLISGDKALPELAGAEDISMNFSQPGGVAIATVALPGDSYPGTDFASAFFRVNRNRMVSEQECSHFAFVDTRNADGEPIDAEKIKIGMTDMETTSSFSVTATRQTEAQYYHSYANGACYEYVLGLGTQGFATDGDIKPVQRDEVFAKLETILASVKINAVEQQPVAESVAGGSIAGGKE